MAVNAVNSSSGAAAQAVQQRKSQETQPQKPAEEAAKASQAQQQQQAQKPDQPKPVVNADGSTDLYFGPKPPPGQARNWLATAPGRGFFVVLRLYGPTEAAIERRWKPGDLERLP